MYRGLQTCDLLALIRVHIRQNRIHALWHLLGNLYALGQLHGTLLERAGQVDIADLVAEVGFLLDQGDQAVFDLQEDFGAGFDVFGEGAGGDDGEVCAGGWWVGVKVYVVDGEDVVFGVGAVL